MNIAAKVRKAKERFPADYCPAKGCLWRIRTSKGFSPCQNHPHLMPKRPDPDCTYCDGGGVIVDDFSGAYPPQYEPTECPCVQERPEPA